MMKKLFKSKGAQITVFIIIGIVLLFSSALIIYIKNKVTDTSIAPTIITNTPEDLDGLKKYIEECLYTTGKEAIKLISYQGGYISPEDSEIKGNVQTPTEDANGLYLEPDIKNRLIPYYSYLKSENTCSDCQFVKSIPPLTKVSTSDDDKSMESQISRYVEDNLWYCIKDFNTFKERGFAINELEQVQVKTTIAREDVTITADWPIEAGTDKLKTIDMFFVKLPVRLKQVYDFADEFIKSQINVSYFETNMMNLITYGQGDDLLPPTADFTFLEGESRKWSFKEVKEKLADIIEIYTPGLRMRNTLNGYRYFYSKTMVQSAMDKMIIDTFEDKGYPFYVDFSYSKKWPIYFDISPRQGDSIRGSTMGGFGVLSLIGIALNQYDFQYDVSYPVLVSILDPEAFQGEGLIYQFAFETNIRSNRPLKGDFYVVSVQGAQKSYACDEAQKNSGNITIITKDSRTDKYLDDVSVKFSFSGEECPVGTTNKNEEGISSLKSQFPIGIGSLLVSKKPEYLSKRELFAAGKDKTAEMEIKLDPLIEKNIIVKKYTINKKGCKDGRWNLNYTAKALEQDETVNIFINKIETFDSPDKIYNSLIINGSLDKNYSLKLGPGLYEATIDMILYKNITIPEQEDCEKHGDEKECVTMEEVSMYPYSEGHLELKDKSIFNITKRDLYSNTTLIFYAIGYDLDSVPINCRKHRNDLLVEPSIEDIMNNTTGQLFMPRFIQ